MFRLSFLPAGCFTTLQVNKAPFCCQVLRIKHFSSLITCLSGRRGVTVLKPWGDREAGKRTRSSEDSDGLKPFGGQTSGVSVLVLGESCTL